MIMENLPEYIEGIPTNKHQVKERFELVMSYYEKLWIKLQRESRSNYIRNEFLDAQIFIVKNESDKKTAREAMHNWKSTYAVKHLQEVVEKARPIDGLSVFSAVKGGAQKKNGYKLIITLYHTFVRKDIPYLNFTAKLTIGVLTNMKHIQYSVNKIEILKQKT
jgi:hypothetical protein